MKPSKGSLTCDLRALVTNVKKDGWTGAISVSELDCSAVWTFSCTTRLSIISTADSKSNLCRCVYSSECRSLAAFFSFPDSALKNKQKRLMHLAPKDLQNAYSFIWLKIILLKENLTLKMPQLLFPSIYSKSVLPIQAQPVTWQKETKDISPELLSYKIKTMHAKMYNDECIFPLVHRQLLPLLMDNAEACGMLALTACRHCWMAKSRVLVCWYSCSPSASCWWLTTALYSIFQLPASLDQYSICSLFLDNKNSFVIMKKTTLLKKETKENKIKTFPP